MPAPNVSINKFRPAALPNVLAPRAELVKEIESLAQVTPILISAPAGSGKTISTLLYLEKTNRSAIWLRLDEYDNVPSIFYRLFCYALLSVQPENQRMINIVQSESFISSPIEHTIMLLSEFWQDENQYALVLDDLHTVSSEEINRSLPYILQRLPNAIVPLLLTRNGPMGVMADMIERGEICLIDAQSFTFTPAEIKGYFKLLGREMTADQAHQAYEYTGGWAMGVVALAQGDPLSTESPAQQSLSRYIDRYIWREWSPDWRDFLLRTCVADQLTIDLANKLSGRSDSRMLLDQLCAANAFIVQLGDGSYAYHNLFCAFLREQLQSSDIDTTSLHRIVAQHYLATGAMLPARRFAVKSGDMAMILEAVYQFTQHTNPSLDEYVSFSKMLNKDAFPESVCEANPFIYTAHMYLAWLMGDAKGACYYIDKLYAHLPAIEKRYPQLLEMVILIISLDHRVPFSHLIENFKKLPPITHKNDRQQGASVTMQMPFLHRSNRDYYELADPQVIAKFRSTYLPLLKDNYLIAEPCLRAGLLLEQNERQTALALCLSAKALTDKIRSPEFVFAANMHLAVTHFTMGDLQNYERIMKEAQSELQALDAGYLHHNFSAVSTRAKLLNGDKQAAQAWLDSYFVLDQDQLPLYKIYQGFVTARAHMVLNQTAEALVMIERLLKLGTDFCRTFDIAEANTLKAALLWAMHKHTAAMEILESALLIMQSHNFIRIVANEGTAVLPILKKLLSRVQQKQYKGALDKAYLNSVYLAAYGQAKWLKGTTAHMTHHLISLSKQQKNVLKHLARGLSRNDIAKLTGLSVHTIKSHIRLIYEKLDVNAAIDAVLAAEKLGLLD